MKLSIADVGSGQVILIFFCNGLVSCGAFGNYEDYHRRQEKAFRHGVLRVPEFIRALNALSELQQVSLRLHANTEVRPLFSGARRTWQRTFQVTLQMTWQSLGKSLGLIGCLVVGRDFCCGFACIALDAPCITLAWICREARRPPTLLGRRVFPAPYCVTRTIGVIDRSLVEVWMAIS